MNVNLDELIEEMQELKDLKARYEFELKHTKEKIERVEGKLIAVLGQLDVKEVQHKNMVFGLKITSRTAFDQKLFAQDHEDLYNQYKTTKEKEDFYCKLVN